MFRNKRGSAFVNISATLGAILVFVGVAWLIAKNWHQIPNLLKTLILVLSTLLAFVVGFLFRVKVHEIAGRAIIALGTLLYILSVFLIAQIYHIPTGNLQDYAWLLLLCWTVILAIAYLLHSPESIIISLLLFFPWVILQYLSSIGGMQSFEKGNFLLGFILLFLSTGVLLYGISLFHNAVKHTYAVLYKFWTILYFLLIFFVLSFKGTLPFLAGFTLDNSVFSPFLMFFILVSFFAFVSSIIFVLSKDTSYSKEVLLFVILIVFLMFFVFSTKLVEGRLGRCLQTSCNDFKNIPECNSAPKDLGCTWSNSNYCDRIACYDFKSEQACKSYYSCAWVNNYCMTNYSRSDSFLKCQSYDNQKGECLKQDSCKWTPSSSFFYGGRGQLPLSLWFLWAVINLTFVLFIIVIIDYARSTGHPSIFTLALLSFVATMISSFVESPLLLPLYVCLVLYGLSLFRYIGGEEKLSGYRTYGVLYLLSFFYVLSFQIVIPYIWNRPSSFGWFGTNLGYPLILNLLIFVWLTLFTHFFLEDTKSRKGKFFTNNELIWMGLIVVVLLLIIFSSKFSALDTTGSISITTLSTFTLIIWILVNFLFIGFIILSMYYGYLIGSKDIIHLGLGIFILEIVTRYIGFWMDFKGYFAFSILAIIGGLLLILTSWLLPRTRRELIQEIQDEKTSN